MQHINPNVSVYYFYKRGMRQELFGSLNVRDFGGCDIWITPFCWGFSRNSSVLVYKIAKGRYKRW